MDKKRELTRLFTGIVYILVILEFFLLRRYLHILCFDVLVLLFTGLGTHEVLRAFGDRIERAQRIVVRIFSLAVILCFSLADTLYRHMQQSDPQIVNYSANLSFVVFMAGSALLFSMLVFRYKKTTLQSTANAFFCLIYPSVFLLVLSGCNHMPQDSEIGILFVFCICPFADCFAYVFGRLFGKKLPAKLAPNVSPNKTLIGGLGGVIGGAVGACAIFFAYYGLLAPADFSLKAANLIFFIALGVLTAAFAEFGDLVESAIKRRLGIKDMGDLLPGHGGVLDRIDSTLYASLIVCFVIVIRIMVTG